MDSGRQNDFARFPLCSAALHSKHLKSFCKSNIEKASFLLDVGLCKTHDLNAREDNYINNLVSKRQEMKTFSDLDKFHKWNVCHPAKL